MNEYIMRDYSVIFLYGKNNMIMSLLAINIVNLRIFREIWIVIVGVLWWVTFQKRWLVHSFMINNNT